jgi:hypothetical protein
MRERKDDDKIEGFQGEIIDPKLSSERKLLNQVKET